MSKVHGEQMKGSPLEAGEPILLAEVQPGVFGLPAGLDGSLLLNLVGVSAGGVRIKRRVTNTVTIPNEQVELQRNPIIEVGAEVVVQAGGELLLL